MSDISISERRLSAALDRIDQYLDQGGAVPGTDASGLRAELEAAQARIAALTAQPAPEGDGGDGMAEQAARLAAANDALAAANRALIAAMAGEDDRIEAVSLALEAEIEALRAARAAESGQLAGLLAEVERLLAEDGGEDAALANDGPPAGSDQSENRREDRRDADRGGI